MGMHESQSRFFENIIGRSPAFWAPIYGKVQEMFPDQMGNVDLDQFVEAVNKVCLLYTSNTRCPKAPAPRSAGAGCGNRRGFSSGRQPGRPQAGASRKAAYRSPPGQGGFPDTGIDGIMKR